jgi:hypothetical protein
MDDMARRHIKRSLLKPFGYGERRQSKNLDGLGSETYVCTYEFAHGNVFQTGRIALDGQPEPGVLIILGPETLRVHEVAPGSQGVSHLVLETI